MGKYPLGKYPLVIHQDLAPRERKKDKCETGDARNEGKISEWREGSNNLQRLDCAETVMQQTSL